MNTKELMIDVLNGAIELYTENGGKVYPGDKIVDYNLDTIRIAPFTDRHPGWIKLYVQLKEGTGEIFFSMKSTMHGNEYYIAWESDNGFHTAFECLRRRFPKGSIEHELFIEHYKQVREELEDIIRKGLFG